MANCCNHFRSPGTLLMGRGLGPSRAIKVLSGKELCFLYLMRKLVLVEFFIKKPLWIVGLTSHLWTTLGPWTHVGTLRILSPGLQTTLSGCGTSRLVKEHYCGCSLLSSKVKKNTQLFSRQGVELYSDEVCSENLWIFLLWKHGVLHYWQADGLPLRDQRGGQPQLQSRRNRFQSRHSYWWT